MRLQPVLDKTSVRDLDLHKSALAVTGKLSIGFKGLPDCMPIACAAKPAPLPVNCWKNGMQVHMSSSPRYSFLNKFRSGVLTCSYACRLRRW